jgi:hypothetical protein
MLTRSPIVVLICSYAATVYGMLYLMFTTIPSVFEKTYGWSTNLTGLAYMPCKLCRCLLGLLTIIVGFGSMVCCSVDFMADVRCVFL